MHSETLPQQRVHRIISRESLPVALSAIIIIATLVFSYRFLLSYPIVDGDEPWFLDAIWNFINNGVMFDTMHTGPLDQYGYEWVRRYFIGTLPWAATLSVAGLGLFQARLTSLLCGVLLLVATFYVGRRSGGQKVGLLATVLLVTSATFFHASHFVRQDIFLAAVLMIAYFVTLVAISEEKLWAHFVAGLIMGLSADVHQNGWLFVPAFAAIYIAHYGMGIFRKRGPWLAVAGGVVGIAYYLVVFILPNPDLYLHLYSFDFNVENASPISGGLRGIVEGIRTEIGRYRFYDNNLEFALIGAGFVYLASRRKLFDRNLVILVGVTFAVYALFRGSKTIYYAILLYPFFMLIIAQALVGLWESTQIRLHHVFIAALVGMMLINNGLHLLRPLEETRGYNYEALGEELRSVIPDGEVVMGLPIWWLALPETEYHSSLTLNFYAYFNDYTFEEGITAIRPDYIIIDRILQGAMEFDDFTTSPYYGLPGDEFNALLEERGELVKSIETPEEWHGTINVFAIDWEQS